MLATAGDGMLVNADIFRFRADPARVGSALRSERAQRVHRHGGRLPVSRAEPNTRRAR